MRSIQPISTIFFDLDGTLYSNRTGLWNAIRDRMNLYLFERLGIPWDETLRLRKHYYQTYGTTLRGLQIHYKVNTDDYLAYVHDLPLDEYLQPNPRLREMLLSLPQERWVFTNADADHARRVIQKIGITGCFVGIIDVRAIKFSCKPEPEAYQRALALAGDPAPEGCLFLDDSLDNLIGAREHGLETILVSHNGESASAAAYAISDILNLPEVMPELWTMTGGKPWQDPENS